MGIKRFAWGVEKQRNKKKQETRNEHSIKRNANTKYQLKVKWWQNCVAVKPIYQMIDIDQCLQSSYVNITFSPPYYKFDFFDVLLS